MRFSIVSLVLVTGASAIVAAAPDDRETTERVGIKDPPPAAPPADGWVELADPTPAKHGRVYITVGAGAGTFSKLRIDVAKGRPTVQQVRVDFKAGGRRVVRVEKTLHATRKPSAYVDLKGAREIRQIVIDSDPHSRGEYTVFALAGDADVATR